MDKVKGFFKKVGTAIANFCKKAWAGIVAGCVAAWNWVKSIPWTQPVRPLVAWCVLGGTILVAVALMLIFWI